MKRVAADGSLLGKKGRPAAFQPHTIAELTAATVIMDKRQLSHTSQSIAKRLRQAQLDAQSNPNFDSKPLSAPTIRKYTQKIAPVSEKGGVNTNARAAALVDLRNFISAAAVSGAALAGVHAELLFNTDVVKLYLCDDKPPQVLTTEEGSAWLKDRNMLAKTPDKQGQRRVVDLNVTSSADGSILHCAIEIRDTQVTEPTYFRVADDMSLWLLPKTHDYSETIVHFTEHVLIPLVEAKRRQLASDLLDPAAPSLMHLRAQKFVAENAHIKAKMQTLRAVFSLDGAQDQTTAFMDYGLGDICKAHSIEYLKWAASCSGTQQPNDVATCHKDLKTANAKIKYDAERPPHVSPVMLTVVKQLPAHGITGASLTTFSKFLYYAPILISKAFSKPTVQQGWSSAGYFPHNVPRILSRCSEWDSLSKLQSDRVLACIPALTDIALHNGKVTDTEIESHLAGTGIIFIGRKKSETAAVSRLRAVWGNNEGFVGEQVELAHQKIVEAQAKADAKIEKLLAMENKKEAEIARKLEKAKKKAAAEEKALAAKFPCVRAACQLLYSDATDKDKLKWKQCDTCEVMCCMLTPCASALHQHEAACKLMPPKAAPVAAAKPAAISSLNRQGTKRKL